MAFAECVSEFFPIHELSSEKTCDDHTSSSNTSDDLHLSQLKIEDDYSLDIPPFYNITPRDIPLSPHRIFEEEFSANPWALLIATVFLTKTSGKVARSFIRDFIIDHPTPYHVLAENPETLGRYFESLGLKKRGRMIWKLTYQFVSSKWRRASDIYGVGKYGEDAYRMFVLGHTDVEPNDRYLKLYSDWLRTSSELIKERSVIDSECLTEDPTLKYYRVTLR